MHGVPRVTFTLVWGSAAAKRLKNTGLYSGVFGDGPSNATNRIFPRATLVAMATKFGTKIGYNSAYVRDTCKIFPSIGGFFGDRPSNDATRIFPRVTLVAMATKFGT